ncbi:MAG: hypothetical protein DRI75_07105 [Bacteroidetes bacterium]|nr:MAG: hypothetical protein DRI75_07105 [Bacteroidota bacterium]
MKTKLLLLTFSFLCLISTLSFGQTYTSGLQSITGSLEVQIDINTTTNIVTLTLLGPDNGWLALGFDSFGHDNKDVVMFDGTNLVDRLFTGGFAEPNSDPVGTHDWTVTSNTTNAGARTVVATRARVSSDAGDYDFSASPTTLNVVGGYENNFDIGNRHTTRGTNTLTFALLGIDDYNKIQFSMSPNPATSNLKIVLPSNLTNSSIEIYDMLARKIFEGKMINTHFSIIDVSAWNSGVYLVKVSNNNSTQTKRFIKK